LGPNGGINRVDNREAYFDYLFNNTVSTTVAFSTVLTPLLGPSGTGILGGYPILARPSFVNNVIIWQTRVRLSRMVVKWRAVGSTGGFVTPGDLYNTMRCVIYKTDEEYATVNIEPLVSVDGGLDLEDTRTVFYDKTILLPTQAFDSSTGTNIPMLASGCLEIPLNLALDCFTSVNAGTSGWNTKLGDLVFSVVSDSSVTPHPSFVCTIRVYYEFHNGLR
jgi:hypothetical protein